MTARDFERGIQDLSILRGVPEDVAAFWELFREVPTTDWLAGVNHAKRTRTFFPVPAELFEDCETARPATVFPPRTQVEGPVTEQFIANPFVPGAGITIKVARHWKYYCEGCLDSGWRMWWCGKGESRYATATCSRIELHGPHTWSNHCSCWDSNPECIRRREATAKSAITRTERR